MNTQTPMISVTNIRAYIYGCGKSATFTIRSVGTGKRFTYRVRKVDAGELYLVDLLSGPDNEADFRYVGQIRPVEGGYRFYAFQDVDPRPRPLSMLAIRFLVARLNQPKNLDASMLEFWHSGECSRCHHRLTDPTSLKRGMGPICAEKAASTFSL